jgi:hypothetical protein
MKRVIVVGLAIWLAATVALRLGGQHVLNPDNIPSVVRLFVVSAALMAWLPRLIFSRQRIPREAWGTAVIALAAPGMLLDSVSTFSFSTIFPNIRPDAAALFGAWLLVCNAAAMISAVTSYSRKSVAR